MATITKFMGNKRVAYGTSSITGSGTVATGLQSVDIVLASAKTDLDGDPAAVSAAPSGTAGSIVLKVYALVEGTPNTLGASTTATDVSWIAIGE